MKYCPHCGFDLESPKVEDHAPPTHEFCNPLGNSPFEGQIFELIVTAQHLPRPETHYGFVIATRSRTLSFRTAKSEVTLIRLRILTERNKLPRNYDVRLGKCVTPNNPKAVPSIANVESPAPEFAEPNSLEQSV